METEKIKTLGDLRQQVDASPKHFFVPDIRIQKQFKQFVEDGDPFPVTVLVQSEHEVNFDWEEMWFDPTTKRKVSRPNWSPQKEKKCRQDFFEYLEELK